MRKILTITLLLFTALFFTTEAQQSQTVNCTAGNLSTLAASYLTTVTNLTVTGTIDARDFKTMRELMTSLTDINLSGASIASYEGDLGIETCFAIYPANKVPNSAFDNCSRLNSINIPNTATTIGYYAFSLCTNLTSVNIPNSVTTIDMFAFENCTGLTSLYIPNSVTDIYYGAFASCTNLITVNISNSLIYIAGGTFNNCTSLTSIIIPNSVTEIAVGAFENCTSLTSIIIPNSVTEIAGGAFENCTALNSIDIPNSVTTIEPSAFRRCSSLTSVNLPNSITAIEDAVFEECTNLTSISIPNSVTSIGDWAFNYCSINSVTIPNSVTSIGNYAFNSCYYLNEIYAESPTPIDLTNSLEVFAYVDKNSCTLHVPVGSLSLYAEANQWKDFITIIDDITPTSTNNILSNSVSIFPIPAKDQITITELNSIASSGTTNILVTDVLGKVIISNELNPSINSLTLNIGNLKSGIYYINIPSNNGKIVKRFIKE